MTVPTIVPDWATDPSAQITVPPPAKRAQGWLAGEQPPAGYFNWWQNLVGEWIDANRADIDALRADVHASIVRETMNAYVRVVPQTTPVAGINAGCMINATGAPIASDWIYHMVGDAGATLGSRDGVNWTALTADAGYVLNFLGVKFAAGRVYAWGAGGEIQSLTPSSSSIWTRRKTGGASVYSLVANVPNTFVFASDGGGHVWRATTGAFTDLGARGGAVPQTGLAAGNVGATPVVVAVSGAGVNVTADDGTTWVPHTVAAGASILGVVYTGLAGMEFVASGYVSPAAKLWVSSDCITWTEIYSDATSLAITQGLVVVPGGVIVYSYDLALPTVRLYDGATFRQLAQLQPLPSGGLADTADRVFFSASPLRSEAVLYLTRQGYGSGLPCVSMSRWSPSQ